MGNTSNNVTLTGIKNYSIAITPDRNKAVLWSQNNSNLYVHTLDTAFTQEYHYNSSLTAKANVPYSISFSADSQIAIIEYDSIHPTILMNLSDFSIIANISIGFTVSSAMFLDNSSRFVMLQTTFG